MDRFQIFLRKHQNIYSNPDTGVTYNVIVSCNSDTCAAEYVPGNVDGTWYDFTEYIEDPNPDQPVSLSLTWDKVNSGDSSNSETSMDGSNYDKGITSELVFRNAAKDFIYNWLLLYECYMLNSIEVKIVDLIAHGTYRIFEIKADNLEYAPIDDPCRMHIQLREQDDVWACIHKTFIFDNWQHWFEDSSTKQHPCFLTCIEPRPRLVQSARMALTFLYHAVPAGIIIDWITGGSLEDEIMRILNANRFVDAPLVRTYIENVAGKCGLSTDTIFDEGQHWQNLCLYYPQAGYMWEIDDNADNPISPSLAYHYDNRWLITIPELFDKLKLVFAAEWYVTPNNTIVFKYTKDLIQLAPIYDFTAPGAEQIYELTYSFNGDKKPAYGRYEYQTDGSDLASQEIANLYNDIVDYDGPQYNPMLEGDVTKNFEFAPTGFIRDGRTKDYMRLLIDDGKTGALILLVILAIVTAALIAGSITVLAAVALGGLLALSIILVEANAASMTNTFVDGPIYSGAVRLTSEQVLTPRLILWDGESMLRAKAEAQFTLPDPNPYYNTTGTAYNVKNDISQDNPDHNIYNYPLYFDSDFEKNLFDNYHDQIDNPLKSLESHQEAKWYVDLCEGMLNLFGVFENQYAVIGKVVKIEKRANYDVYVRIGNINVDYGNDRIELKGTVLRRCGAQTTVTTSDVSNDTVSEDQLLGLNGQVSVNPVSYDNADFRAAIADMGIEMIREPGGTIANSSEWETVSPSVNDCKLLHDDIPDLKFSFVLNMITRTLPDNLAWLAALAADGIPITHVEMGNEFPNPYEWLDTFSTNANYASVCRTWIAAISAIYPDCKFGIPGGNRTNATSEWNQEMLAENPDAYLVYHYHNRQQYAPGGIVNVSLINNLIDEDINSAFAGISPSRIWVTEYNLKVKTGGGNEEPVTFADDYQHGLAASTMMKKFYDLGCPVVLFHNVVLADGNGAIFANGAGASLRPTGVAIKNLIPTLQ